MNHRKKSRTYLVCTSFLCLLLVGLTGCGKQEQEQVQEEPSETEEQVQEQLSETEEHVAVTTGIVGESAKDASVDFAVLKEENPEIFAWLYIPDTEIDYPVLQSMQGDDFYEDHNARGEEDANGAIYIELANMNNMCDFNTVLHGNAGPDDKGPFAELEKFRDPDFFEKHDTMYLYLDGNALTYIIFAAFERENTSLLRSYDFTYLSGCQEFLDDMYGIRDLRMNLREGWENVTPYHFLTTLTVQSEEDADKQFVVVAILSQDATGTIDRVIAE